MAVQGRDTLSINRWSTFPAALPGEAHRHGERHGLSDSANFAG
jgi:hypothetical protein